LLMLYKEIAPLLQDTRDQELYEMKLEEHLWLAEKKDKIQKGVENRCRHF
jgi:hypothetical protein